MSRWRASKLKISQTWLHGLNLGFHALIVRSSDVLNFKKEDNDHLFHACGVFLTFSPPDFLFAGFILWLPSLCLFIFLKFRGQQKHSSARQKHISNLQEGLLVSYLLLCGNEFCTCLFTPKWQGWRRTVQIAAIFGF